MTSRLRKYVWVSAFGAVLVAATTACGSSTTSPPAATAGTGATGTTTAANVVKIGVIAPLDAGLTDFGHGIRNSVQLAVDEANRHNAIPGYTIVVEAIDDSSDPAKGEAAAKKLAEDPKVIAVVGPYNSGVAAKAAPVLAKAGIALISPSNTNPTLTLGDDVTKPARPNATYFRMVGNDIAQAAFLAKEARSKLNANSVAVVSETKAVSKGLADNFVTDAKKNGTEVLVQQVVPDNADDFSGFINAAKPLKPSLIFFGGEYPVAAKLRAQATAAGLTVPIMGGDGMKDDAYLSTPAAGDLASSVGAPAQNLETAKEYFEDYEKAKFKEKPTDYGPYAYDATNLVIKAAGPAVAQAKGVNASVQKAVVDGLQNAKSSGATGPIAFDAYGDAKQPEFTLYRVKDTSGKLAWDPLVSERVDTTT